MKKLFIIILIIFAFTKLVAQSDVRLNNYWWKTSIINPAYMSKDYLAEFDMAYRNQWTIFPGAPKTLYVSGAYYIDDLHTRVGLRAIQDKIGYTSSTNVSLIYSYATKTSYYWRLQMGVAFSYQNQSYDISKIDSQTPTDPALLNLLVNENRLNADVGVEMTDDLWTFGAAGQNLASIFRKEKSRFQNTNIVYGMYRHHVNPRLDFSYGIAGIQSKNIYQAEFHFSSYFKNAFQVGAFYRTPNEMGVLFGIDLGKNMQLYYSYDYNIGGISRSSVGSHEIMISYNLEKIYKCNCWYNDD